MADPALGLKGEHQADQLLAGGLGHSEAVTEPVVLDGGARRLRRYRIGVIAVVTLVIAVTVAVLLAIGSGAIDNPVRQDEAAPWRTAVGVVLTAVALPLMGLGLVRMVSSGAFKTTNQKLMFALSRRERRQAYRWVRRGEPVPRGFEHQAAAVALAFRRQGRAVPLYIGVALNALGQLLRATSPWLLGLLAVACLATPFAIAQLLRDARRGARWLAAHPASTIDTDGGPERRRGAAS